MNNNIANDTFQFDSHIIETRKSKRNVFNTVIIALLLINLCVSSYLLFRNTGVGQVGLKNDALEYTQSIAKECIEITNDKISGNNSITGNIENISSNKLSEIIIKYRILNNGTTVDYVQTYISYLEPGENIEFSVYAPFDEFNDYELCSLVAQYN